MRPWILVLAIFASLSLSARADRREQWEQSIKELRDFVNFVSNPDRNSTDCAITVESQEWKKYSAKVVLNLTKSSGQFQITLEPEVNVVSGFPGKKYGTNSDFGSDFGSSQSPGSSWFEFSEISEMIDERPAPPSGGIGIWVTQKQVLKATFRDPKVYYNGDGSLTSIAVTSSLNDYSSPPQLRRHRDYSVTEMICNRR